ncbi:MAG TPA: S1/P1 nuclease [Pyrinomonadaceae bacterium]|nr:S1/P1 nuclease [Pyrinomonadaceae bacterium]
MHKLVPLLLSICLFSTHALAYGPRGHKLVGSIADKRLAKNRPVAKKVRKLLDGLTLEQVATLPDNIKGWDDCRGTGNDDPVTSRPRINEELRAFWQANKCGKKPSHDVFHYTDVPVTGGENYADGTIGRDEFDVVKMIPFCIGVLRGEIPETNDRAITKAVAVILLTHYIGDIHQPLHVGAEFFNADGDAFHPSEGNKFFGDQGGNKLILFTFMDGTLKSAGKLHSYWDGQTVKNAFGETDALDPNSAKRLARLKPAGWELDGGIETWATQMADEILPVAREARTRLEYENVLIPSSGHEIKSGDAKERRSDDGEFYAVWAAKVVKKEVHKGGWRLAAVLEEALE